MERYREWDERRKGRAGLKQKHEDDETIVHNMNTLRRYISENEMDNEGNDEYSE
jgi:hypothetical protein